jgi:hypothetical protein
MTHALLLILVIALAVVVAFSVARAAKALAKEAHAKIDALRAEVRVELANVRGRVDATEEKAKAELHSVAAEIAGKL